LTLRLHKSPEHLLRPLLKLNPGKEMRSGATSSGTLAELIFSTNSSIISMEDKQMQAPQIDEEKKTLEEKRGIPRPCSESYSSWCHHGPWVD
jgi:hypothetical protein